jgi:opacity protein-like surface antigen
MSAAVLPLGFRDRSSRDIPPTKAISMNRRWLAPLLILAATPVHAQSGEWTYRATLYGWLSGLSTSIDTPRGTVSTDLSFSDILDDLQMAAFATFEARRGDWGYIADLNYTDLSSSRDTPVGVLFSSAEVDSELTILAGYAAYRIVDGPTGYVDLAPGFRAYSLDIDVNIEGAAAPTLSYSSSENWFDAVIGLRGGAPVSDRWSVRGFADVGGFGLGESSDLSWQVAGFVNYAFNERWSADLGYRYLSVEKEINGFDTTLELSGPVIGISARF